jgi:hypothetical protein
MTEAEMALLFLLLSFGCYRAQRIVTTDAWPPSQWLRDKLTEVGKGKSSKSRVADYFAEMVECPWCFGTILTVVAVFLVHVHVVTLPWHWGLWAGAVAAAVGLIGELDNR